MYNKDEKAIIWIDLFDFLTTKKQEEILALFDSPKDIFAEFSKSYNLLSNLLSKEQFDKRAV